LAAASAVLALTASACTSLPFGGDDTAAPSRTNDVAVAQQPPAGQAALRSFYAQKLAWKKCRSFQCAQLSVPVDYAKPEGDTVELAVLKAPGRGSGAKRSLVVNPGGPGASGVQYAASADYVASSAVRKAFDVVGFDPRGVGSSAPITCLDDRELDGFLAEDPTPDDLAEQRTLADGAKDFAAQCKANGGPLLAHVSTVEAARDMDILRAALGQTQLDYLGKSYGTFLGATYADLFPENVGSFVLDGAIAPDLTERQVNLGQAIGFETATRAYVQHCVKGRDCPLGGSLEGGMARLREFLQELDGHPIPVDDTHIQTIAEGWGSLGVARAMYDQGLWERLTVALRDAMNGHGGKLFELAKGYADREDDGSYAGNTMQVIYAVSCLDRGGTADLSYYEGEAKAYAAKAPTWGPFLAWGSIPCGYWPVKATGAPRKITAAGSNPIVVVGTTRDPATPYAWAQQLAAQLQKGHLITFDGDGHTAYMRSNSCVDKAVDAYLLKGTVPAEGLTC